MHARKRGGARRVDADDARVRVRGAQQLGVQHPRQHEVVGEPRLTGDLGAAVDAAPRAADDARVGRHSRAFAADAAMSAAAASTASKICR